VELLGEWLDKKHGDNLGFKRNTRNGTIDFATNKALKEGKNLSQTKGGKE
jgi:hypothetical protein